LRCIERCADACTPMNRPLLLALDELTYIHVSTSFTYPILKKVPLGRVPQEPMCKKGVNYASTMPAPSTEKSRQKHLPTAKDAAERCAQVYNFDASYASELSWSQNLR
jgi:hypothetical protein